MCAPPFIYCKGIPIPHLNPKKEDALMKHTNRIKSLAKSNNRAESAGKRTYISQADVPKHPIAEVIALAKALHENFNGESAPHELANAMSISPTSSAWQSVTGAAVAYGLTEGAYNAVHIKLTALGFRIVAPEEEGDDTRATREATLRPRILREFFLKYNRGKFPPEQIGMNVLVSMGASKERARAVYEMAKANGLLAGLITNTKTGLYVALDSSAATPSKAFDEESTETEQEIQGEPADEARNGRDSGRQPVQNDKVFITHGKNRSIVDQLKEILKFGKFEPVVATEHETTSKPVPDKVLEDMRTCFASVIHVESEQELLTVSGDKLQRINENVLIEIGASMALYGRNFVLLVKNGIHLPSNLQGLYCCFYDGDKLDYEATMKLLKAFNEFR
jgi:predicted nucleotide-binding protein